MRNQPYSMAKLIWFYAGTIAIIWQYYEWYKYVRPDILVPLIKTNKKKPDKIKPGRSARVL
ncbi:MAG TPA: hypothetical protein DEA87_00370 [Candidatus Veblenbacteria bacterium]|nr:hypothetical protein [Candidatus Veblenbacteria bacterium]HBT91934.1 hypothetical protein [Candidatus Veblenbacteria bacterium]HCX39392.1 hypothetical protein [Candidatus Veblenbacteria bacterium]